MSGITGQEHEADYLQVGSVKFPLPIAPPGQDGDWGVLHFAPMEPFSASTVAGDDTLISDDRIPQQIWSDLRAGMGTHSYLESESLSGYSDGDLDTHYAGLICLPPKRNYLDVSGGSFTAAYGLRGMLLPSTSQWDFLIWSYESHYVQYYDPSAKKFDTKNLNNPSTNYPTGVIWTGTKVLIATMNDGIKTFDPATGTWGSGWSATCAGFCFHDNKVYTMSGGYMYWATAANAAGATAWDATSGGGKSTSTLEMAAASENVVQLIEWRNASDERAVLVVTDQRMVFYADQDYFQHFVWHPRRGGRPHATVWIRDDNLYVTNWPWDEQVTVYDHQTADEIGPNKGGGIEPGQRFAVMSLDGHRRELFGICTDQSIPVTLQLRDLGGRVLRTGEAFGWSGMGRAKLADPDDWDSTIEATVIGGFYADERVYTLFDDQTVCYQEVPDDGTVPFYLDQFDFDAGPNWLVSAWTDASLEQILKLAEWWRLNAIRYDETFGVPAGCSIAFKFQVDGGNWTSLPIATSQASSPVGLLMMQSMAESSQQWPAVFPLPTREDQSGVAFYRLRWAVGLTGAGDLTPILRSIALHYVRLPRIFDGLQVAIDLSEQRFLYMQDALFYGLDKEALRYELTKLRLGIGGYQWPVTIGYGGTERVYNAMDVRISGDEDPSTGLGRYTLTLRDLTAPPSGK